VGDPDHRRQGRLDMPHEVAWDIHAGGEDSWDRGPWADREAGHGHHRWPAGLVEGIWLCRLVEAALRPSCGGEGRQYGQAQRPALERRPG